MAVIDLVKIKKTHGNKGRYKGKKRSPEACKAISDGLKGHKTSEETKKKISEALKGHILSEVTRKKMSAKLKGIRVTEEAKRKISNKLKGHVVSLETRNKIRAGNIGKKHPPCSEEQRQRMILLHKMGRFRNSNTSKTYKQGKFYSLKNNRQLHYRSSYELQAYKIFEKDDKVISYENEPFSIRYKDKNNIERGYRPDVLVIYVNGKKDLVEIKPKKFLQENILKFEIGRKYADENNMNFVIMTEDDLKQK